MGRADQVEPRGEYVLVLDGAPAAAPAEDDELMAALSRRLEDGASARDAAAAVAAEFGVAKRRAYALAVTLR